MPNITWCWFLAVTGPEMDDRWGLLGGAFW
jgi:hypothetical protein